MERETLKGGDGRGEIYGSFFLGSSEYALSVSSIQEVVNPPASYTAVPLSPPYLIGLFNLRGTIIPVINLRRLLKLDAQQEQAPPLVKIAIVEFNQVCIGLQFDRTGEIFRPDPSLRSDLEYGAGDPERAVIEGAFKLNNGERIVQLLSPEKLLGLESLPRETEGAGNAGGLRGNTRRSRGLRKQCISFVVGAARCALPINQIQEIIKVERVTESTLAVGSCIGTINIRGNITPVVDFAALLGYREVDRTETATSGDRRIIVMRLENECFGLLVDLVESIINYFTEDLISLPAIGNKRKNLFLGCISRENKGEILLLDHAEILSDKEVTEMTRGHSEIYKVREGGAKSLESESSLRKTYVTFRLGSLFGVEISQIREIIAYPRELLRPPGLPSGCPGVLNLRGELVTIIDPRSIYGLGNLDSPSAQKVLVFKHNEDKFGLVVDSVEAIHTLSESDKVRVPEILYDRGGSSACMDAKEAIQFNASKGESVTVLLMEPTSVISRVLSDKAA